MRYPQGIDSQEGHIVNIFYLNRIRNYLVSKSFSPTFGHNTFGHQTYGCNTFGKHDGWLTPTIVKIHPFANPYI